MIRQSRLHTLVQNWLGLTRYETDQVVSVMCEHEDIEDMTDDDLRALSEEAFECLNENRTLGRVVFNRP
jgi:hypothetical protein